MAHKKILINHCLASSVTATAAAAAAAPQLD